MVRGGGEAVSGRVDAEDPDADRIRGLGRIAARGGRAQDAQRVGIARGAGRSQVSTVVEAEDLIRGAAEWRLLSLLLECPGDRWRRQVRELGSAMHDLLLKSAAEKALEEADEGLYHSAFGPGGPAGPREVSYSDSVQLGYLFSEVEAYYEAFGYVPATAEPADHISVETGFVAFLLMKQAYAVAAENGEGAAVTEEARQRFLGEHLSWIAGPLAERLEGSSLEYLAIAGRALAARVGPSRERRPLPAGALPVMSADSEFSCGNEADGL
jgi:nitrate reductase assembly molybdenum cofactor insertion protein NarJ